MLFCQLPDVLISAFSECFLNELAIINIEHPVCKRYLNMSIWGVSLLSNFSVKFNHQGRRHMLKRGQWVFILFLYPSGVRVVDPRNLYRVISSIPIKPLCAILVELRLCKFKLVVRVSDLFFFHIEVPVEVFVGRRNNHAVRPQPKNVLKQLLVPA